MTDKRLAISSALACTITTIGGLHSAAQTRPRPAATVSATTTVAAKPAPNTASFLKNLMPSPVRSVIPAANPVHVAIRSSQAMMMPFLSTGNLRIAEACTLPAANGVGPAGIWIETEHSPLTLREAEDLIIFCHAQGLAPVVRVKKNDVDLFKQILDAGALGVVIPQIHGAQDAAQAVKSCLYAPAGFRPAGVGRASGFFTRFPEYKDAANDLMSVMLMVETEDAVRNIDAICDQMRSGKDVLWIGPYDLSQDMKVEFGSDKHKAAIESVEQAARKHGITLGGNAATLDQASEMFQRGYRIFTYGDPPETALAKSASEFFKPSPRSDR